jgi:hypothetical protein
MRLVFIQTKNGRDATDRVSRARLKFDLMRKVLDDSTISLGPGDHGLRLGARLADA